MNASSQHLAAEALAHSILYQKVQSHLQGTHPEERISG